MSFTLGAPLVPLLEDHAEKPFTQWLAAHSMQDVLEAQLRDTVAGGMVGMRLRWEGEEIVPEPFSAEQYYPARHLLYGYDAAEACLLWQREHENGQLGHYLMHYAAEETGYHLHYGDVQLGEQGQCQAPVPLHREEKPYPVLPLVVMHNLSTDAYGLGVSSFTHGVGLVQAIALLETIALIEIQSHFMSKLAIPMTHIHHVQRMEKLSEGGGFDPSYYIFPDDGSIPQYVQKDNAFFTPLFDLIATLKQELSLQWGVPLSLLMRETTGTEKVELSQVRRRPFVQMIRQYQRRVQRYLTQMAGVYYRLLGYEETPVLRWQWGEVLAPDSYKETERILSQLEAGVISKTEARQLLGMEGQA
ncbi:hypothetical protein H6771_02740 [Candidatus Peribacteria bacterium]|nr:hypothetical protein [Candidatus Peribacteria bacterium]